MNKIGYILETIEHKLISDKLILKADDSMNVVNRTRVNYTDIPGVLIEVAGITYL